MGSCDFQRCSTVFLIFRFWLCFLNIFLHFFFLKVFLFSRVFGWVLYLGFLGGSCFLFEFSKVLLGMVLLCACHFFEGFLVVVFTRYPLGFSFFHL